MAPVPRKLHVILNVDSDEEKRSVRKTPGNIQNTHGIDEVAGTKRKHRAQPSVSGSRRAQRTRKAGEGIVTSTNRTIPPELAKIRQSFLYLKMIPQSICREELNREIEDQIVEDGLEDEDLVETWTFFYEEAAYDAVVASDEGFGADDV